MTSNHHLIELCKKVRYDLTAAQGKLTDIMQALEGAQIRSEPVDSVEQIRKQIRNGAISDAVDLAAEVKGAGLGDPEWAQLGHELALTRRAKALGVAYEADEAAQAQAEETT